MTIKRNCQLEVTLWTVIGMLVVMFLLLRWLAPWVALCSSISLGIGCCFLYGVGFEATGHLIGKARK